jgi:hypothetical protein
MESGYRGAYLEDGTIDEERLERFEMEFGQSAAPG